MATAETETSSDERVPPGGLVYDGFISYSHAADDLLAPRLQAGLQRFAKPWWKRRALRIFRDESSLSANPHLWSSITDALDQSAWFVLLLSPEAAESPWVNNEVEYWLEHMDPDRIIPVLTDGDFTWFDDDFVSDAAPPALVGAFSSEPRWVDLRFARTEEQLDLNNPRFSAAIADVASAIRGVPKDELESEEVRQHRRTVRTAWGAGALVLALAFVAGGAAIFAVGQRNEAEAQTEVAVTERDRAVAAEDAATTAAEAEAVQRTAAEHQAGIARARELAASAIDAAETDSQLALLLATTAIDRLPADEPIGPALENGLRTAMASDALLDTYDDRMVPGPSFLDVSPDGTRIAMTVLPSRTLEVLDAETLDPIWTYQEDTQDGFEWVAYSSEGSYVILSVSDAQYTQHAAFVEGDPIGEPDARIVVFDATTGDIVHTETILGACAANAWPGSWREDLGLFGFGFVGCGPAEFEGTVRFVETDNWTTVYEHPASDFPHATFADEGTVVAVFSGFNSEFDSAILDAATWETIREIDYPWGDLSPDGTLLAGSAFDSFLGVAIEDTVTGDTVDKLVIDAFPWNPRFSSDGNRLVVADFGDLIHIFDPWSGSKEAELITGPSDSHALRGNDLYTMWEGTASRWDAVGGSKGDIDTVPLNLWVNGNSIFWAGETVFAHVADINTGDWWFYPVDPGTGALSEAIPATDAWDKIPISGNRIFLQRGQETEGGVEVGPYEVLNLDTGQVTEIAGCWMEIEAADDHKPCPDGTPNPSGQLAWPGSKDGSEFMVFDSLEPEDLPRETFVYIWDSETLTEKERFSLGELDAFGNQLAFSAMTDRYLILANRRTQRLTIIDRATKEVVPFDQGDAEPDKLEHDRARNRIWMSNNGNTVWLLDLDDLSVRQVTDPVPGTVRALASSPTGDRIAVGSSEGNLRIWSEDGELLHLVPLVNPSDAWWLDDEHLAVGTANGPWTVITLNPAELVEIARNRIVRGFTEPECDLYDLDC